MTEPFGDYMRRIRKAKRFTLEAIAIQMNTTLQSIQRYEKSERAIPFDVAMVWADVVGEDRETVASVWVAANGGPSTMLRESGGYYNSDPDLSAIIEFYEGNPTKRRILRGMIDLMAEDGDVLDPGLEDRVKAAEKAKEKG